jgi:hypothetical protein
MFKGGQRNNVDELTFCLFDVGLRQLSKACGQRMNLSLQLQHGERILLC